MARRACSGWYIECHPSHAAAAHCMRTHAPPTTPPHAPIPPLILHQPNPWNITVSNSNHSSNFYIRMLIIINVYCTYRTTKSNLTRKIRRHLEFIKEFLKKSRTNQSQKLLPIYDVQKVSDELIMIPTRIVNGEFTKRRERNKVSELRNPFIENEIKIVRLGGSLRTYTNFVTVSSAMNNRCWPQFGLFGTRTHTTTIPLSVKHTNISATI